MPQTATFHMDDFSMNWNDSSKRKPAECRGCGTLTTGRMQVERSGLEGSASEARCMPCATNFAFARAIRTLDGGAA